MHKVKPQALVTPQAVSAMMRDSERGGRCSRFCCCGRTRNSPRRGPQAPCDLHLVLRPGHPANHAGPMTAAGLGSVVKLKKARGEYPITGSTGCCAPADIGQAT